MPIEVIEVPIEEKTHFCLEKARASKLYLLKD
jgi:hypothetical protein